MTAVLRKLAASLGVRFSDGTQAQTLVGTDFVLERSEHDLVFKIDLSSNLQPRNKGLLCYYEAQGLLAQHDKLQNVSIRDKELVAQLTRELKPDTLLSLVLSLGNDNIFTYVAQSGISDREIMLTIQEVRQAA